MYISKRWKYDQKYTYRNLTQRLYEELDTLLSLNYELLVWLMVKLEVNLHVYLYEQRQCRLSRGSYTEVQEDIRFMGTSTTVVKYLANEVFQ